MLRWVAPFGAAILIIGWNRELEDWQVALSFTAALLVAMLLQVTASKNKDLESNKDNVVSLDEFRRQRHGSAFEENQARLQNVFETQYLHEAEMMASMLESEGIPGGRGRGGGRQDAADELRRQLGAEPRGEVSGGGRGWC